MPVKMIATDLDGTLLRTDKTISGYTSSVFRRCRDRGIKTMFATARPIRGVEMLRLDMTFDAAAYHNGAVSTIGGEAFRNVGIERQTATELLMEATARFREMRISVEIADTHYANYDVTRIWTDFSSVLTDFSDLPEKPADKIVFVTADKAKIAEIIGMLPDDLYAVVAENRMLMVMHNGARKLNAVREVAKHFGLPLSEVAAFGDDFNDVEMLRECGFGVAVANAIPEAGAAARFTCGDNDCDGVAGWIEKNVLSQ
ncbi:MAG: Cof-type HAD-IIB family hydrolase [Oscillospiraceae bacterium]|nr:Cof-type HAD-IIB family hydrolase [Oscillospiraceae bacterium]